MNLLNRSTTLVSADLEPLIEFVTRRVKYSSYTKVMVLDLKASATFAKGKSYLHSPLSTTSDRPSLVQVWMPPASTAYPRRSSAIPILRPVSVMSWQEEFVLVLAHEMQHICQFWGESFYQGQEQEAELEAEDTARTILARFREKEAAVAA